MTKDGSGMEHEAVWKRQNAIYIKKYKFKKGSNAKTMVNMS